MAKLTDRVNNLEKDHATVRESMVAVKKDVEHIKNRIEDGISKTVTKTWDGMTELGKAVADLKFCVSEKFGPLKEKVKENTSWREKMQRNIIRIGLSGIGVSGLATILYLLLRRG